MRESTSVPSRTGARRSQLRVSAKHFVFKGHGAEALSYDEINPYAFCVHCRSHVSLELQSQVDATEDARCHRAL